MKTIFTLLLSVLAITTCAQPGLKKIEIIETNNINLSVEKNSIRLPESLNDPEYSGLRNYIGKAYKPEGPGELEFFTGLMQWVSNQWEHDGWNPAPRGMTSLEILESVKQKGVRYRCVEYGKVLNDALISFGYIARQVGLQSYDVEYGGVGKGHVATEVWSNEHGKWVFLDPQFGIRAEYNHAPLNIYDIYKLKSEGKFGDVEFLKFDKGKKVRDNDYPKFLTNYLAYINVGYKEGDEIFSKTLMLEGNKPHIVFQGFPSGNTIFTNKYDEVYYGLNETSIIIDFAKEEYERGMAEYTKVKDEIKSEETYNKYLYKYAAKPDLAIYPINDMPWFKEYEVTLNGSRIESKGKYYYFKLKEGLNEIRVTSINEAGIRAQTTFIKIRYQ